MYLLILTIAGMDYIFGRIFHKLIRSPCCWSLNWFFVHPLFFYSVTKIKIFLNWWCETAGFSWILQNESVEQISLNECILNAGHGFYTKQQNQTYTDKVMPWSTHKLELSICNFLKWYKLALLN
jgi:hypothetical protein